MVTDRLMFPIIKKLDKNTFVKNVAVMATGAAASQIVLILFTPALTRIYGPEAFGILGAFIALLAVVSPLVSMSLPLAIVLPKKPSEAVGLIKTSFIIAFAICGIISIPLIFYGELIAHFLNIQQLGTYIGLVPLAALMFVLYQISEQWLIRNQEFKKISLVALINSLIVNLIKICIGILSPTGFILIAATILGYFTHAISLLMSVKINKSKITKKRGMNSKQLLVKYKSFPLYRAPQICINAISQGLPVLLLTSFFEPKAAGFYLLAKMVMGAPSNLIGKAVGDVIYPKISIAKTNGNAISPMIKKATAGLLIFGLIPFVLIFIFGPILFSLLFGDEWIIAGEYARWLSVFFLFNLINRPCVAAVPILELQKGLLVYEFFSTSTKILALAIGFYVFNSDIVAVALFSIFGVIAYILMMIWIYKAALKKDLYEKTS